jgi:hypothetical protein
MKLSKNKTKKHKEAEAILNKDSLTFEEKKFVLENWHEGATNMNSSVGAFFTPSGLARDFSIEIGHDNLVDLCAGIGCLSFYAYYHRGIRNITCVEINPEYLKIGKKILPEANWILGDVLDVDLIKSLGEFTQSISNPPFGNIKSTKVKNWLKYTGSDFEFKVIEIASKISKQGTFILPQMSTPFKYSGEGFMQSNESEKYNKFKDQTKIEFEFNCGIDTGIYINDWNDVSPMCEIINVEFDSVRNNRELVAIQQTLF